MMTLLHSSSIFRVQQKREKIEFFVTVQLLLMQELQLQSVYTKYIRDKYEALNANDQGYKWLKFNTKTSDN